MNRIRELRKQMDMTQKELAIHLQIADSTLSYWEMGKYEPDHEALMRLSRFFQVPIDYILGGDFVTWDINRSTMRHQGADVSRLPGSDMSVSEPDAEYCTQAAFNRIEFEGLTQGEVDSLAEYALFIKFRRNR